jgi:hypothetical protein
MKQSFTAPLPVRNGPFRDLHFCADGSERARQPFRSWTELWIFTGTRCNLSCSGCYTESNPRNDSFRFLTLAQAESILREAGDLGVPKISFTGGEPYFNPEFPAILDRALEMGFKCLVLTNLTKPFEARGRDAVRARIRAGAPLQIRASLDHPDPVIHERQHLSRPQIRRYPVPAGLNGLSGYWFETGFHRGPGSFRHTLDNLRDLSEIDAHLSVAGRGPRGVGGKSFQAYAAETEPRYHDLFRKNGLVTDLPLKIFPDIGSREDRDVPEITQNRCRTLIAPETFDGLMCNTIRMVAVPAERNGLPNHTPFVFPCTIVPDNPLMALGTSLREAQDSETYLADPRCYRFCVGGGASCSES